MDDLLLSTINIINSKQSAGEGGGFAEGYEEGFVDLTLGVDEDTTKEEDETANGEDGSPKSPKMIQKKSPTDLTDRTDF